MAKNFAPHLMKDGRFISGIGFISVGHVRVTDMESSFTIVAPVSLSNTYVGLLLHDIFSGLSFLTLTDFLLGRRNHSLTSRLLSDMLSI